MAMPWAQRTQQLLSPPKALTPLQPMHLAIRRFILFIVALGSQPNAAAAISAEGVVLMQSRHQSHMVSHVFIAG